MQKSRPHDEKSGQEQLKALMQRNEETGASDKPEFKGGKQARRERRKKQRQYESR